MSDDVDDDWIVVAPSVEFSDDGFEILVESVVIVENVESVVVSSLNVVLADEAKLDNEFDSLEKNSDIIVVIDDVKSLSVVGSLVVGVMCVVFVVLMAIKVGSGFNGLVSSMFVAELADVVEDSFGTVVVLVVLVDE